MERLAPGAEPEQTAQRYFAGLQNLQGQWIMSYTAGRDTESERPVWKNYMVADRDHCMVDFIGGHSIAPASVCAHPLKPGNEWVIEESAASEKVSVRYRVMQTTEIETRLGRFTATQIQTVRPLVPATDGTVKMNYWYVPALRGMIRIEREFLDSKGKRFEFWSEELTSFRAGAFKGEPSRVNWRPK